MRLFADDTAGRLGAFGVVGGKYACASVRKRVLTQPGR